MRSQKEIDAFAAKATAWIGSQSTFRTPDLLSYMETNGTEGKLAQRVYKVLKDLCAEGRIVAIDKNQFAVIY